MTERVYQDDIIAKAREAFPGAEPPEWVPIAGACHPHANIPVKAFASSDGESVALHCALCNAYIFVIAVAAREPN